MQDSRRNRGPKTSLSVLLHMGNKLLILLIPRTDETHSETHWESLIDEMNIIIIRHQKRTASHSDRKSTDIDRKIGHSILLCGYQLRERRDSVRINAQGRCIRSKTPVESQSRNQVLPSKDRLQTGGRSLPDGKPDSDRAIGRG